MKQASIQFQLTEVDTLSKLNWHFRTIIYFLDCNFVKAKFLANYGPLFRLLSSSFSWNT